MRLMLGHLLLLLLCLFVTTLTEALTKTVSSTHPRVLLLSEPQHCPLNDTIACDRPWNMGEYVDGTGHWRTYHYATSTGNKPYSRHARRLQFTFQGTSIKIYGAPRLQLKRYRLEPGEIELCIEGGCQMIKTTDKYWGADESRPVLLWSYSGFPRQRDHVLELRLLDTSAVGQAVKVMTIQMIKYEDQTNEPHQGYELHDDEEFADIIYYDTNPLVSYLPESSCLTNDPERCEHWNQRVGFLASDDSTLHEIGFFDHNARDSTPPGFLFSFHGVMLSIYGASKNQLRHLSSDGDIHPAQLEICVDKVCDGIDAYQLYLAISDNDASKPVLLWSQTWNSLSHNHQRVWLHYDRSTSTLDPDAQVHMTLNALVVKEVRKKILPGPDIPLVPIIVKSDWSTFNFLPPPSSDHLSSWTRQQYRSPDGTEQFYMHTAEHNSSDTQPTWSFSLKGSDVRIFGAPPLQLERYSGWDVAQEVCVDAACYPIDVAHAYYTAEDKTQPLLLWSSNRLDVLQKHMVVMRMLDTRGTVTLHHITYSNTEATVPVRTSRHWLTAGTALIVLVGLAAGVWFIVKTRVKNEHQASEAILDASPAVHDYGAIPSSESTDRAPTVADVRATESESDWTHA